MTVAQTDNTIMINQTLGTNLGFELVLTSGMDGELWIIWMDVCFSYHPKKLKSKQLLFRQKAISNRMFYAIPICTISCNPHSDFEKSRLLRHHRDPCASWSFATPHGWVWNSPGRSELWVFMWPKWCLECMSCQRMSPWHCEKWKMEEWFQWEVDINIHKLNIVIWER